jgi:hypothetical protein
MPSYQPPRSTRSWHICRASNSAICQLVHDVTSLAKALPILAVYAVLGIAVSAQGPSDEDCQSCHAEPSMVRADGRPVVVEPATFAQSIHAGLGCLGCHTDLAKAEFPHPEKLQPVQCGMCHEEQAALFSKGLHAAIPASATGTVGCSTCHGPPHQIRPSSDPESLTNKNHVATTCGQCHGDTPTPGLPKGPAVAGLFADSIHGQALARTTVAPTCSNCHRSHDIRRKTEAESPVHPTNIPVTCGTCHGNQQRLYEQSVHAEVLKAGTSQAPQCASCHTAHSIRATDTHAWQVSAVQQCGTCHREALQTYRDTFHGQVTALGFEPVAKCIDCHQSHGIVRISNAASPVAPANRLATCQTCHPSATANFAQYQPHANKHNPEESPQLYYAALLMDGIVYGTFAFFGLHTLLWFLRERTGRREEPSTAK